MIIVILGYIIILIYVYIKYVKKKNIIVSYDENIEELDPALLGYIYNKNVNPLNLLLAEMLDLNRKGYIKIEYIRKDTDKYEYVFEKIEGIDLKQLEDYELTAYRLLFDETGREIVKMSDLEAEFVNERSKENNAIVKGLSINESIKEKLKELKIINLEKEKK